MELLQLLHGVKLSILVEPTHCGQTDSRSLGRHAQPHILLNLSLSLNDNNIPGLSSCVNYPFSGSCLLSPGLAINDRFLTSAQHKTCLVADST